MYSLLIFNSVMFKKRELILFSRDRLAAMLLGGLLLGMLILVFGSILNAHISDVQVPIRYSVFGFTNFYRDRWYALLSFGLFGVMLFVVNGFLAIKLHSVSKGVSLAILGCSLLVCILAILVSNLVFHLAVASI